MTLNCTVRKSKKKVLKAKINFEMNLTLESDGQNNFSEVHTSTTSRPFWIMNNYEINCLTALAS